MPLFKPRQRKHKVIQRTKDRHGVERNLDSNALEILPERSVESAVKRLAARKGMNLEMSTMSSQKRKRLDKYLVNFWKSILYVYEYGHSQSLRTRK